MGKTTKVQLIQRANSEQWYLILPTPIAKALDFKKGEVVEWMIEDRSQLVIRRVAPSPSPLKKKR